MTIELRLLDEYTARDTSVPGPVLDAMGVAFTEEGAILDKIATLAFTIPIRNIRDNKVASGKAIQVWDTDLGELNVFLITERSIKPNGDATTATMTCPEVTQELQWAVVPGLAANAGSQLTERLNAILANVNIDWPVFVPPKTFLQWAVTNQITDLNGLGWNLRGKNVAGAIGEVGKLYNAHWKKGTGRRIIFGRMGEDSGITLSMWATNPDGQDKSARRIVDYEVGEDAIGIVNEITPLGSGNGDTAISLAPLYGRTDFVGYDPVHPVLARIRQDSPPAPNPQTPPAYLYDFFIQDSVSIFGSVAQGTPAWRRRQAFMTANNITPGGTTAAYVEAAAVALYNVALTSLKYHSQPTNTLHVVTEHHGDLRGLGGKLVHVDIREADEDGQPGLTITRPYYVLEARRVQAEDGWLCDWTLCTQALWEETLDTQIIGGLEAIKYFTTYASVFPSETNIWLEKDLDYTHPITLNVRQNKRSVKTVEALFTVTTKPVLSTATAAASVGHAHGVTIPALSVTIPALSVTIPALSVTIPALNAAATTVDHQHSDNTAQHGHTAAAGAHSDHAAAAGAHTHGIIGTKPWIDLKGVGAIMKAAVGKNGESVVTDVLGTANTGDHTHGSGSSGGAAYTTAPSVGAGGGFSINSGGFSSTGLGSGNGAGIWGTTTPATGTTTAATGTSTVATGTSTVTTATTTTGGEHTHELTYGIYEGPIPTGIRFIVDNVELSPYASGTGWTDYDATSLLNDQNRHTITIASTSLGRVQVEGQITRYVTTGLGASNI